MAVIGLLALAAPGASAVGIDDAIVARVYEMYDLEPGAHQVEITSNRLTIKIVNPDDLTLTAISQRNPIGPFVMLAEVRDNGKLIDRGQVRLRIARFADCLVANGRVSRHEALTSEQFEYRRMEITSLLEQSVRSFEDIQGQRSTRSLRKGDILTSGGLEPIPDIEVGGEVSIVYDDGVCCVTAPGRAMQTGWAGRPVRVKNTATGKVITARVIDGRSVAVEP
jgi:flagella basal body P-ring formation protein FlgA